MNLRSYFIAIMLVFGKANLYAQSPSTPFDRAGGQFCCICSMTPGKSIDGRYCSAVKEEAICADKDGDCRWNNGRCADWQRNDCASFEEKMKSSGECGVVSTQEDFMGNKKVDLSVCKNLPLKYILYTGHGTPGATGAKLCNALPTLCVKDAKLADELHIQDLACFGAAGGGAQNIMNKLQLLTPKFAAKGCNLVTLTTYPDPTITQDGLCPRQLTVIVSLNCKENKATRTEVDCSNFAGVQSVWDPVGKACVPTGKK